MNTHSHRWIATIVAGTLLAGCDGVFTVDLGTNPPADPAIADVQANLLGVELRKADSTSTTLEFRDSEPVDLRDLASASTPLRLFTSETLPTGDYTGIRLLFDTAVDAKVVDTAGATFPMRLAAGNFAGMDFTVEEDKRSTETLSLALDLRQSLAFDETTDEYTLTPVLRSVQTAAAAQVSGTVSVACPTGSTMLEDGAVYLYQGTNVDPDDLDGAGAEPFATTRIVQEPVSGGALTYALRFLPAADYTLALTCKGDDDALGASNDLVFSNTQNISLGDGEAMTLDLD
jgi:hypothetical protein